MSRHDLYWRGGIALVFLVGMLLLLPSRSPPLTGQAISSCSPTLMNEESENTEPVGNNMIDLNELSPGFLRRTYRVVPGATYKAFFGLGANTDGPPDIKTLTVSFGSITRNLATDGAEGIYDTLQTVAANSTLTLAFASTTTGGGGHGLCPTDHSCFGPLLGDVEVTCVALPMSSSSQSSSHCPGGTSPCAGVICGRAVCQDTRIDVGGGCCLCGANCATCPQDPSCRSSASSCFQPSCPAMPIPPGCVQDPSYIPPPRDPCSCPRTPPYICPSSSPTSSKQSSSDNISQSSSRSASASSRRSSPGSSSSSSTLKGFCCHPNHTPQNCMFVGTNPRDSRPLGCPDNLPFYVEESECRAQCPIASSRSNSSRSSVRSSSRVSSVSSTHLCGNGRIEPPEECDAGPPTTPIAWQPIPLLAQVVGGIRPACDGPTPPQCPTGSTLRCNGSVTASFSCALIVGIDTFTYEPRCMVNGQQGTPTCIAVAGSAVSSQAGICPLGTTCNRFICRCEGAQCVSVRCGDGIRGPGEQCDDGNTVSGDGCSALCTVEQGWQCSPGGSEDGI